MVVDPKYQDTYLMIMTEKVRILVVEDEFMISEDMSMRLSDFGYHVSGIAQSGEDALAILETGNTDLALVDINIEGEMNGIELASIIRDKYQIPFIFLTSLASNSIVEKAKETHPSAYLLKPFNDRQVQISIEMALENYSKQISPVVSDIQSDKKHLKNDDVLTIKNDFFVRKDNSFVKMHVDDIVYLTAEGSYTAIHTLKTKHLLCQVLKYFDSILPHDKFVRVHRSHIVNISCINKIDGNMLVMPDNKMVPVGKNYKEKLFENLHII